MKIPFVDLHKQYLSIKDEIDDAIHHVISETAFIKSKYVTEFEEKFAEKNGVKHCIGVGNGTDSIYIVLKMLGIGVGDEVITTAHSWIATSETITQAGAKPVFVDIDEFFLIDTQKIEEKITKNTKAIIPVHLYGQPCEMNKIIMLAEKYNLFIIEDCAQAHFAEYKDQKVGTFGIAATFSFYPGKNLGAYGDAGAIITNDDELAEKCRMYANHGALKKHYHEMEGINSRLDGLQAAIIAVKLKYIDKWNQRRYDNAFLYSKLLSDVPGIITPDIKNHVKHIFHVYCIQVEKREKLMNHLNKNGVGTQIHYPMMLPFMPAYKYLGYNQFDFPNAYNIQDRILSLPMFPELGEEEIVYICDLITDFYNS
ncbi:MAG: DegT/DnrJ/EryC1/StrS family aminotransferase [Ignavibacteriales bacterium]|nr:DegT/DnrJ/EryC1/StrS family aminotransferase [Ignavibacteriales bacterium]